MILGVGNLLLRDEGVGVQVIKALEDRPLPAGIELLDGGTLGIDLLAYISEAERIIVVDAVKGGGEPGAIYRLTPEILVQFKEQALSLHQVGFLEVLDLSEQLGNRPEAIIYGIEPQVIDWGLELTEPVQAAVPRVVELVLVEAEKMLKL
jgi:hydrogenase maturation protease